jgi:glycosyltransferase involved in cell wall biosynthesis
MREVEAVLWVVGERLSSDHAAGIDHHIREIQSDPKLANKIRFLGQRTDVPELLRAADIFVLPSHREGMPRSILEAMMSRLPVVATNIRGSREEVIDRQTGFLVTPRAPQELARALKALTDDQHLRLQMGETGRKRALEYFDERRVISRQIELLGL